MGLRLGHLLHFQLFWYLPLLRNIIGHFKYMDFSSIVRFTFNKHINPTSCSQCEYKVIITLYIDIYIAKHPQETFWQCLKGPFTLRIPPASGARAPRLHKDIKQRKYMDRVGKQTLVMLTKTERTQYYFPTPSQMFQGAFLPQLNDILPPKLLGERMNSTPCSRRASRG